MKFASKSRKQQNALWVWPTVLTFLLPGITGIFLHCCCPALPSSPHFSSSLSSFLLCLPGNKSCSECDQPCSCPWLILHLGFLPSCQAHPCHKPEKRFFPFGKRGRRVWECPSPCSMCSPAEVLPPAALTSTRIHGTRGQSCCGKGINLFL